ncbi:MAG: hypothetical protein JRN20_18890 [Nitrososphaerota archaeon]|nr:hypothetical protein [Nitrososphaerota archaeon]
MTTESVASKQRNTFGDSFGEVMERVYNSVLPIPNTPRLYRGPKPKRVISWIPRGKLNTTEYLRQLSTFASEIEELNSQRTSSVKYSVRGWCYLLEGLQKIDKDEFSFCSKAINDCRKMGLLPIDFVAEDQDVTRHFQGVLEATDVKASLSKLKEDVNDYLETLPSTVTDYWKDEKNYVMMCVEKGDLLNLFQPICREYHVPIVSSKGWAPILLRHHIAKLSRKAESLGLTPVLLLFYDLDPVGWKISQRFRKNLEDCSRGTRWHPNKIVIERIGLNEEDIEKYNLTWIENLKSSSGRTPRDPEYEARFGKKKCESNALFKNDETLQAAEEICRRWIEKFYGSDATERFKKKEENVKKTKLAKLYENHAWDGFFTEIDKLSRELAATAEQANDTASPDTGNISASQEEETTVYITESYYGHCPKCHKPFDYDENEDIGRSVRCSNCHAKLKLMRESSNSSP